MKKLLVGLLVISMVLLTSCSLLGSGTQMSLNTAGLSISNVEGLQSIYVYEIESTSHPSFWNSDYKYYVSTRPLQARTIEAVGFTLNNADKFVVTLKKDAKYELIPSAQKDGNGYLITGYYVNSTGWQTEENIETLLNNRRVFYIEKETISIEYWNGLYPTDKQMEGYLVSPGYINNLMGPENFGSESKPWSFVEYTFKCGENIDKLNTQSLVKFAGNESMSIEQVREKYNSYYWGGVNWSPGASYYRMESIEEITVYISRDSATKNTTTTYDFKISGTSVK